MQLDLARMTLGLSDAEDCFAALSIGPWTPSVFIRLLNGDAMVEELVDEPYCVPEANFRGRLGFVASVM